MARRVCACGICDTTNLPSFCASCINIRLLESYKLLKRLLKRREFLHSRVESQLKAKHEADQQHHWIATHKENIAKLKEKLQDSENELQRGQAELKDKQCELDARSHFFALASAQLAKKQVEQLGQPDLVRTHFLRQASIASEIHKRRRFLFRQLCKVFPLRHLPPSNSGERQAPNGTQVWTICSACLPIGDDPLSVAKQDLGASLGYMLQLLELVAYYLSAPLLHNARIVGSASRIWQRFSYWDGYSSSSSDEYPLHLPLHSISGEHGLSDRGTSILGFSSFEGSGEGSRLDGGHASTSGSVSGTHRRYEMPNEVQKGIKLLKRSVSCVSSYGFNLLPSSVPANMTTFQALAELLALLSSKDTRLRAIRSSQHQLNSLTESAFSTTSIMDITRQEREHRGTNEGNFNITNSFFYIGKEFEQLEGRSGETVLEGWDMVEHPTLPPPPSHSEDVEHWTRAMFVDAKK